MIAKIEKETGKTTWLVDGKPFIAYAGEVHNSSASNLDYMANQVWPYVKDLNLNTLIVPVYWEQIEPIQGTFDFSVLTGLVEQARENNMKLIILWFGLWKNGLSSYTPRWVKKEVNDYKRVIDDNGKRLDTISPLCHEAVNADKQAFVQLMKKIKELDSVQQTIIAVQIENEMGTLGSDRDYSAEADKLFHSEIPEALSNHYGVSGTYEMAFGKEAPEVFMAYAYATATEKIAQAGKEVYPLPFFVNAWIEKYPWQPGNYPSGGPVAKFIPLWQKITPSIDALAPDIYVSNFATICDDYRASNNPLLIPEHRRDVQYISNVFYAVGNYQALCFAPFGVEDFMKEPSELTGMSNPKVMELLAIDKGAFRSENTAPYLKRAYSILQNVHENLLECREREQVFSFIRKDEHEKGVIIETEAYDIKIDFHPVRPDIPQASGIILQQSFDEFIILGTSFTYKFLPKKSEQCKVGVLDYEEGQFIDGKWQTTRILNGDERYVMLMMDMPELHRVSLYKY